MSRKSMLAIILVAILTISLAVLVSVDRTPFNVTSLNRRLAAVNYLTSNFNSTVGLIAEVPSWNASLLHNHLFWIMSDNMLAYYALKNYNSTVSNAILNRIKEYAINYSLPTNNEGIPVSYKHEVLIGTPLPDTFSCWENYYHMSETPLDLASWEVIMHYTETVDPLIVAEVSNGTVREDWTEYADLALYHAIDFYLKGEMDEAVSLYSNVVNMWDGYGINDRQHIERPDWGYEIYKLCLLEYTRKLLSQPNLPFQYKLTNTVFGAQHANGGIRTHYKQNGGYVDYLGYTNTETTAIFIIANIDILSP